MEVTKWLKPSGTRDKWIAAEMVATFEMAMKAAGKTYRSYCYEADHAFASPTQARYDAEDAKLAWRRNFFFLNEQLKDQKARRG
ncbi:MAG: dienelactone hydrolase family protein [Rhodospirillales bacterium]|nr:dienelactone hydrolase family protein [Rhodospirillales bacterium]